MKTLWARLLGGFGHDRPGHPSGAGQHFTRIISLFPRCSKSGPPSGRF